MRGRRDRYRIGDRIGAGKLHGKLADAGQALHDFFRTEMLDLQMHVIAMLATALAGANFLRDGACHHVARSQILGIRRIAGHELLAILVDQIAALPSHTFGNQAAHLRNAGRVELPELHVLQRQAGAQHHAEAIAGVDMGVGGMAEDAAGATGRQQRGA